MATIISKRFPEDDARKLKGICGIMKTNVTTVINSVMTDWVREHEGVLTGITGKRVPRTGTRKTKEEI